MPKVKYKRVLLKLSGEILGGKQSFGLDPAILGTLADEIKSAQRHGVQIAVVVGGGNIFRGLAGTNHGIDRATGDYMGMLATVINAMALQAVIEAEGVPCRVQSAIEMKEVAEPYIRRRAMRHLAKGRVVIFAGGTGNPYFTTDTTAALRAAEIQADVILKATKVDGVYDRDPVGHPGAKMFSKVRYMDVLRKRLKIMDSTAISLCMDNNIPILVFNVAKKGNIERAILGKRVGTVVEE